MSDLRWLKELHRKIWNRKDLELELFREVAVTRTHYDELQNLLHDLPKDRDSPGYDGHQRDVQGVKLNFLLSIIRRQAPHPDSNDNRRVDDDDSGESDEGGAALQSLFPFHLKFLDLSSLELKEELPDRFPLPLLIRQEYKEITELIKRKPQNSGGSVIVSGQPGLGEFLVSVSHSL